MTTDLWGHASPERHELVAELVTKYRNAVDTDLDTETVLSDLIADLMHFADSLPADERIEGDGAGRIADTVIEKACFHYEEEIG